MIDVDLKVFAEYTWMDRDMVDETSLMAYSPPQIFHCITLANNNQIWGPQIVLGVITGPWAWCLLPDISLHMILSGLVV